MYTLPKTITVQDREFPIRENGDYRMVLDCFAALNDIELTEQYRVFTAMVIFFEDLNDIDDLSTYSDYIEGMVKGMFKFMNCGEENPEHSQNIKLVDWEQDSQLICSAINRVANTEIRAVPYCHWWTFMGYYSAIDAESSFANIVNIRNKIARGKKLEKHESEFRRNNPRYFNMSYKTTQQLEDEQWIRELWNSGGKEG